MRRFKGGCHCGNMSFVYQWPDDESLPDDSDVRIPARACGCSFCIRHGASYTSHPEGRLDAEIQDLSLISRYRFGTRTAEFFICRRCGVVPFVTSSIEGALYAVVNVNTIDPGGGISFAPSTADFNDEGVEDRLARRARSWIPDVRIVTP
jgi:hypothetical protein